MSDAPLVLVDDDDGVRTITLNRPDSLNAVNGPIMPVLTDAVADAARDTAVGCVILTGAGRGFCSGGDLREGGGKTGPATPERGGRTEQSFDWLRNAIEAPRLLHDMKKPTIAMINGPVAGAGIGLAGACDLRLASETATFTAAFDRIGAGGDYGSTWFWSKIVGSGIVREIFMMGETYDAPTALAKGVYTRVFPEATLREETMRVARRLADGPRMGWRYMKENLNYAEHGQFVTALDREALHMGLSTLATGQIYKSMKASRDQG